MTFPHPGHEDGDFVPLDAGGAGWVVAGQGGGVGNVLSGANEDDLAVLTHNGVVLEGSAFARDENVGYDTRGLVFALGLGRRVLS